MRRVLAVAAIAAAVTLPTAAVSSADSTGSRAPHVVRYVSLGDSVTSAAPSFVDMTARMAAATLHAKVAVTRVVEEGNVSSLLGRVRDDPKLRALLRTADLITITLGANEIGASLDRVGNQTCGGSDGAACVRKAERAFEQSYRALLDTLARLRSPRRAAYRLLTSYDTPSAFPPGLGKPFTAALRAENAFVCSQAARRAMRCADVYALFNGADGTQDPLTAGLVVQDGHPSARGSAAIAKVVSAAGFAPLS